MKVLLTSQEVPPHTGWGGIGTYVGAIAPALARAGAEVHVLSVAPGQERSIEIGLDGVRVHRAPLLRPRGLGRVSRLPLTTDRLAVAATVAREYGRLGERFDVVESPEWKSEALFLTRRVPVVVRLHSGAAQIFPHQGPMGVDHRLAARCEDALTRRAHLVIGTTSQLADAGRRLGPLRTREIPLPVPSEPTPYPAGPPRVLYTGRFEPRKSPETIVRAAPAVLAELPDARFVFIGRDTSRPGRPSYAAWLRELATSLGVAHAVEIHDGWRPRRAVLDAIREAHVCAVPSLWESFGYAAAEAASVARPVVASRIPGLADVVGDRVTGVLVPPADPGAWARALVGLLGDRASAGAMGAIAASHVERRFDPDLVAGLQLAAYGEAIGRFGARAGSRDRVGASR